MRLAQVLAVCGAVAIQAVAAGPDNAVTVHVMTASGSLDNVLFPAPESPSTPGHSANSTTTAQWASSNTTRSATVTKTSATQASQSTSQPPDTTAGATIPQHAESSMVGLLGFFIVGLLVL
ncbi:unnamed protein product [Clonostachys byssicola]|uniref:Uncharacterized protein n=1 Tax=Clonostachys byssicola TaxID=160290 RepID=A0A9N9U8V4_9HYPO|nr:unnamed protein product [Clonostachys byssicola]